LFVFIAVTGLSNIASAQNIEKPRTLVENIYSNYTSNPNFPDVQRTEWFSPALRALTRRDKATNPPDYVGKLDFDLFALVKTLRAFAL
jgi:hypothetical protein